MELQTSLAGIPLEHPLMNGAGICKIIEGHNGVKELARSSSAAVMVGSFTLESRPDKDSETYFSNRNFSLNSFDLANRGADFYKENLPKMAAIARNHKKPLFASVAGFTVAEYGLLAAIALDGGADLVELNLSCPNVWKGDRQERIACFDPGLVDEIIACVDSKAASWERVKQRKARIAVKISPFSDPVALSQTAAVIGRWQRIGAVTAVNTFPNAFGYNEQGKSQLISAGGLAGLGGPALRPIGLGQVKQLRSMLPEEIDIIGVGGISTGQDVLDYLKTGAKAVQIASIFFERGPKIFDQLLMELISVCDN